MDAFISSNLLWTEGSFICWWLLVSALFGLLIYRPLLWVALVMFGMTLYFFRNPERVCQQALRDDAFIVCPADGTIVDIAFDKYDGLEGYAQRVSIFLSPLDAHVMWTPTAGFIDRVAYRAGTFTFAFLPKSSVYNEKNDIVIRNARGAIQVRQIAGAFARRICCWVHAGDSVSVGYKYGMIRFGSRVDVFLPGTVSLQISIGQKVEGGSTILGRW
jgi:phosphatidylserine decarboxylase